MEGLRQSQDILYFTLEFGKM